MGSFKHLALQDDVTNVDACEHTDTHMNAHLASRISSCIMMTSSYFGISQLPCNTKEMLALRLLIMLT